MPEACLPWRVIRTKPNHERMVSSVLSRYFGQFEQFLPLYSATSRWTDRTKTIERPLIPGYLFSRFDPSRDKPAILQVPGVLSILSFCNEPVSVEDRELEDFRAVAEDSTARPEQYADLKTGDLVRVVYGPFKDRQGRVISVKGTSRLYINLDVLNRAVSVELDREAVRTI